MKIYFSKPFFFWPFHFYFLQRARRRKVRNSFRKLFGQKMQRNVKHFDIYERGCKQLLQQHWKHLLRKSMHNWHGQKSEFGPGKVFLRSCFLFWNQTPRIPYSCYCYYCYCCFVTKSALWQYLGKQAWYHRSAGVKTTGKKFWITKFKI